MTLALETWKQAQHVPGLVFDAECPGFKDGFEWLEIVRKIYDIYIYTSMSYTYLYPYRDRTTFL